MFNLHVKGKDGERFLLLPGLGTSTPITGGPTAQEAKAILDNFDAAARKKIYEGFFGPGKPIDPFVEQKQFPTGNGVSRPSFNPTARAEDINIHVVRLGIEDRMGKALFLAFLSKRIVVNAAPLNNYENEERSANLKVQIRQALQKIIAEEKREAAAIEAKLSKQGWWEKTKTYSGALGDGLYEAGKGLAIWAKDVAEVAAYVNPVRQAVVITGSLIEQGELSWESLEKANNTYLTGAKKEIVDVLGFDPSALTAEQFDMALEVATLIYNDSGLRSIFYKFAKDYAAAQHSLELTEMAGGGVFEIILTVVLAAVTAGAGAVASLGSKVRYMKNFQKVGDLVMDYVKVIQRRKKLEQEANAKVNKGTLSDLTTSETVETDAPKKASGDGSSKADESSNQADDGKSGETDTKTCSPDAANTCTNGEPISMVTGEELLQQQDFVLRGPIPLAWTRTYRTTNPRNRTLGFGWGHPACENLFELDDKRIRFTTGEGLYVVIPRPKLGETTHNKAEGLRLTRFENGYLLQKKGHPQKFFEGIGSRKKISRWVDTLGNALTFNYDSDLRRKLISISSTTGQQLAFTYNGQGLITAIDLVSSSQESESTETSRTLVRYQYDEHGDLIAIVDGNDHAEKFEYTNHIVTKRTLKTGFSFYFEWDKFAPDAKCTRQWGDKGRYDYRFEWDDANKRSKAIDSNGNVLQYEYNDRGQITQETNPEGGVTRNAYDAYGRLIHTRNPNGDATQYRYDDNGNLIETVDALGNTQKLTYNENDQVIKLVVNDQIVFHRSYSDNGLLIEQQDAEGNKTEYQYDQRGFPTKIIRHGFDGESISQELRWNALGQLIQETKPDGSEVSYNYDNLGNITRVAAPLGTQQYRYDDNGNVILAIDHTGGVTRFAYNENNQLTRYTDVSGRSTEYHYDGLAQVVKKVLPNGAELHYEYDKERNLTGLINENGERYQLEYDGNERLTKEIGFDGRVQAYQYDAAGFLVAHIEGDHNNSHQAKLNTTQFKRDALGRLLEKLSPDGEVTTFAYDKHGRLAQANNASQQLRFHYNASGRLIEEHQGEQVLRHSYNSLGLRTQTVLPSGDTLKYRFNNIGQLQSASFNDQLITKLKHNNLGQIAERKQGELTSEYDYDAMGRLSEHRVLSQAQKHAVIQRNYRYTQAGNLESIDDLNKGSTQYFYDALDRLKQVEGFVNEQFDFDPANNLIQQSEQPKAEQAQQNPNQATESAQEFANNNVVSLDKAREQKAEKQAKGNRLAFQGDRHFTYDSRGNLIKEARGKNGKLVTSFTYNAQNQLIEIDNCGTKTRYQYDALGRRIKKISADTETQFLWNGDVLLSETQYGKNAEQKELLNAKIYVFEPNSFKPLAQIQNKEIYHYHLDHLGTPQELTANDGSIVWSAQYKTYGNLALKTVETIENNIRFQGQYFDQETGLHYNRHRYYNPNTGQFTQQDPVGLLGGLNNYQYAPNPIGWIDPFGLTCKEGFAYIYHYEGPTSPHFTIVTEFDGKKFGTEQIGSEGERTLDMEFNPLDAEMPLLAVYKVKLADAEASQKYQRDLVDQGYGALDRAGYDPDRLDTPMYCVETQSCLTHVFDVLNAGGKPAPKTSPVGLSTRRYMKSIEKESKSYDSKG
ncbi:RHS repeat-associated core domain-containing protein [Sessilibacter sp. MAH4]